MKALARKSTTIPDKLFFKIGEVSRIAGVEPYVLRYWETEFSFLKPRKNQSGQRVYLRKDVEMVLSIKSLLYEEKYTIAGVRKRLGGHASPGQKKRTLSPTEKLENVKEALRSILERLEKPL